MATEETEKEFTVWVRDVVRQVGGFNIQRHFADSRRQVKPGVFVGDKDSRGWPDWAFINPVLNELIFVELKRNSGKVSYDQRDLLQHLADCGVPSYIWRPRDRAKIEKIMLDYRSKMRDAEVV